jgi:hypothetical protein
MEQRRVGEGYISEMLTHGSGNINRGVSRGYMA